MKKIVFTVFLFALLVPAAFAAPPAQSSSAYCKANATSLIGAGLLYKTFGACVAKQNTQQDAGATNAAKACNAEQADPNFAAGHGGKTFAQFYGTTAANGATGAKGANGKGNGANGNGDAFGKCV